jgi:hypothetical protein
MLQGSYRCYCAISGNLIRKSESECCLNIYLVGRNYFKSQRVAVSREQGHKKYVTAYTEWSKSLCEPDDCSIKNTRKYFKTFQSLTVIT